MGLARFLLRTTVGCTVMGHGLQKLKGSFGGSGLEGTEKMMESLGLPPPKYQAWAVALSETVGGGLAAVGLLNPLGPSMIIGSQVVAINKVHLKNGFWAHKGGYEYNLTLIASAFALAELGPGAFSLDRLFGKRRSGLGWALASTAVALGAAMATLRLADKSRAEGASARETGREDASAGATGHEKPGAGEKGHGAPGEAGDGTESAGEGGGPTSTDASGEPAEAGESGS